MNLPNYTYRPIAVSSLFTAHNSQAENYAFASKERDTETGLSYFGARYYSSELSIWLSVDPMIDKYPSFSPYVYCANNPIKLVDSNGEEIDENLDKWKYNITTGELKWISDEGGKDHQTVVMTCGKGENEKQYQQVGIEGPISKMFDPTVVGPKADGTINGALDMVNGAITTFAGAVVAVGSEGAASPIGYLVFIAGTAQMSTGAKEIAYSLNGDNDLYQQHDMMVDICKSATNSVSGVIRSFRNNPVKATVKAVSGFMVSITWSGIQRRRATHPQYLGIPQGATIKSLP